MVFRRKSEVTLTPNNYSHNHTIMNTTINDTTQTQNKSANNENKAHIDNENYQGPTPFHTSCYLASSLEEMEDCYEQSRINEKHPHSHQHSHHLEPDGEGRFPLDLLFLNSALAESLQVEDSSSTSTSTSSQMMNMNMNINMSFDKKRLRKVAEFALDIIAHQSAWENENNNKSVSTRNNIVNKWGIQIKWHVFDYWIQQVEGRNDECTGRVSNNNSHYSQWSFIKEMFGNPSSRLGVTKLQHDDDDNNDDDDDAMASSSSYEQNMNLSNNDTDIHRDTHVTGKISLSLQVMYALSLLSSMIEQSRKDKRNSSSNRSLYTNTDSNTRSVQENSIDEINYCIAKDKDSTKKVKKKKLGIGTRSKHKNKDISNQKDEPSSTSFKQLSGSNNNNNTTDISPQLIKSFASISNLMKSFLMIDDDEERGKVFECIAVKNAMMVKESLAQTCWLKTMLQDKHYQPKAVDYLKCLSDVSKEEAEKGCDKEKLKEICHAIGAIDGFIPSMLAVEEKYIEELSTLPMITTVLDDMMSTPFTSVLFFFDFLLLALQIIFFRMCVDAYMQRMDSQTVLKLLYATLFSSFHFQMRGIAKYVSLMSKPKANSFRKNAFFNFWNISYTLCIGMVIWCIITIRVYVPLGPDNYLLDTRIRTQFSITTFLLWLHVLCLIKAVNVKLATFVSAIIQIVKDTMWYVALIVGVVLCFSQVFYTLLFPEECGQGCDIPKPHEYYLKTYSIMLGELDEDIIDAIDGKVIANLVFYAFTFIMAIIMLNVLIAVISDSYEKSLVKSTQLFGRARVDLLAEILALEDLFRVNKGNTWHNKWLDWAPIQWTKGGVAFFSITTVVYVLWAIIDVIFAFRIKGNDINVTTISIVVYVANLVVFFVFLYLLARAAQKSNNSTEKNSFIKFVYTAIQWLMHRLLGKSNDILHDRDEWSGRLIFIKKEITGATKSLSQSIQEVRQGIRNEEIKSSKQMKAFRKDFDLKMNELQNQIEILTRMNESNQTHRTYYNERMRSSQGEDCTEI